MEEIQLLEKERDEAWKNYFTASKEVLAPLFDKWSAAEKRLEDAQQKSKETQ